MAIDKLKRITELLDGKGSILIRNAHDNQSGQWFVHCHWNWSSWVQSEVTLDERIGKVIFKDYVTDLEAALDEIIENLGGNEK
jgi:hypothetical protein